MRTVLLCAGGTGGHLFPAEALRAELARRGHPVALVTDPRAQALETGFPPEAVHIVPSATFRSGRIGDRIDTLVRLAIGYFKALLLIARLRPAAVVGFGGYPTLPPLMAARTLWRPTVVHEANAVAGRANRLLARLCPVATAFPVVKGLKGARVPPVQTGLPVRPAVLHVAGAVYPELAPDGRFRLLAFGGSQGARVLADVVPAALAALPEALRARIDLVQQCRPEDLDRVRAALAAAGLEAELAPFFSDLPARIAASHLVVSRSGASTVAELATVGRPAILVPLPHAVDQDQAHNAKAFETAGGGLTIPQGDFTPARLAAEIEALAGDAARLAKAAEAARALAEDDAAARLADLVEAVIAGRAALDRLRKEASK